MQPGSPSRSLRDERTWISSDLREPVEFRSVMCVVENRCEPRLIEPGYNEKDDRTCSLLWT